VSSRFRSAARFAVGEASWYTAGVPSPKLEQTATEASAEAEERE
jgi:hypothetical protein